MDQLYIESYYTHADHELAVRHHHSTTRMSGLVARRAGATEITPIHFSRRYQDRLGELVRECRDAFEGGAQEPA